MSSRDFGETSGEVSDGVYVDLMRNGEEMAVNLVDAFGKDADGDRRGLLLVMNQTRTEWLVHARPNRHRGGMGKTRSRSHVCPLRSNTATRENTPRGGPI